MFLLQNIEVIDPSFFSINENFLTKLLLYGDKTINEHAKTFILNYVSDYILPTKWFDNPLILQSLSIHML